MGIDCLIILNLIFIEQILVNISGESTNSVTFTLFCDRNGTTALQFMLEIPNENLQHDNITLICGMSENVTDLTPNKDYVLFRKYVGQVDPVLCRVQNFTTDLDNESKWQNADITTIR